MSPSEPIREHYEKVLRVEEHARKERGKACRRLGESLREKRLARELPLRELAGRLGVSGAFLCAIEHGKRRLPERLLSRLEHLLGEEGGPR